MSDLAPLPPERRLAIADAIAPPGFAYPSRFRAVLDGRLPDLTPNAFLYYREGFAEAVAEELKTMYPYRSLVPFAKTRWGDDVYCFDGDDTSGDPPVHVIHVMASPGWEHRGTWRNFDDWLLDIEEIRSEWLAGEV